MNESATEPAERVILERPEETCLLGLLMRDLLTRNLADDSLHARVRDLDADIQVGAGDMVVTMRFAGGRLRIVEGESAAARAKVSGTFGAMLGVVTGGGLVGPVLGGDIRIGGNPFLLLRILPLIRARRNEEVNAK